MSLLDGPKQPVELHFFTDFINKSHLRNTVRTFSAYPMIFLAPRATECIKREALKKEISLVDTLKHG